MVDDLLVFLLRSGAHREPLRMTTTEIGAMTGMSQQNASRRLRALEKEGSVERKGSLIKLTEGGAAEMKGLMASLQNAFEARLEIRGRIADGLGDGRFYLSRHGYKRQMKEKLGFEPYAGTLNLKLERSEAEKRRRLLQLEPIVIEGFREGERTFGDLFAFLAEADGVGCAIVVPLRTHHGHDVMELAAPVNLRKRLGKGTGDEILLKVGQVP